MNRTTDNPLDYFASHSTAEQRIAKELRETIEDSLFRIGLLCRVFARVKSPESLQAKLAAKQATYRREGRKMQDLFGVRVVLYFSDDSTIAQRVVKDVFDYVDASVTELENESFGPTRCNLIFRLPQGLAEQSPALRRYDLVDTTFEVQFRTVLSEGWHEVEHDLRYKRKDEWEPHADLSRALNGVMATLESCDWSLLKIFDELAWRHYKARNVAAMVQARFRLRMQPDPPGMEALWALLEARDDLCKRVFRVDRSELLGEVMGIDGRIPITAPNVVILCNHFFVQDPEIDALAPPPIRDVLDRHDARVAGA